MFEAFLNGDRRRRARRNRFRYVLKIRRTVQPKFGPNQDIFIAQTREFPQGFLANQNREHLLRNGERRFELFRRIQGKLDIDGNDDVDVHIAHDTHRDIPEQPAIDERAAVDNDRRKYTGRRHACANGKLNVAPRHYMGLAGGYVSCYRPEWNWQIVEVMHVINVQQLLAKNQRQLLSLDKPLGQLQAAVP